MNQRKVVSKGGISASAHTVHLVLTVCTFGFWSPVWFLHWLFTRNKTVTHLPPQPPMGLSPLTHQHLRPYQPPQYPPRR